LVIGGQRSFHQSERAHYNHLLRKNNSSVLDAEFKKLHMYQRPSIIYGIEISNPQESQTLRYDVNQLKF